MNNRFVEINAVIETLDMIVKDMENDAKEFDGQPLNGKTVATYFGYHGAAIATLANIIKKVLIEKISKRRLFRKDWYD